MTSDITLAVAEVDARIARLENRIAKTNDGYGTKVQFAEQAHLEGLRVLVAADPVVASRFLRGELS